MTIACRCSMALVQSNNEGKNIHVHTGVRIQNS